MARIRNGILGGFSNKVGEVIGQNYAGVSTMRAMPKYVANPKTPAQEEHRARLALAGSFLSSFTRAFSFSRFNKSVVSNGFNNALRSNFKNFIIDPSGLLQTDLFSLDLGEYIGDPILDVVVSVATLEEFQEYMNVTVEWSAQNVSEWSSPQDTLILFAVQEVSKGVYKPLFCQVLPEEREAETSVVVVPCGLDVDTGTKIYFAIAVVAACLVMTISNPQKPSDTIKIPTKRAEGGRDMSKNTTITIPPHNIPAFKSSGNFVVEVERKHGV